MPSLDAAACAGLMDELIELTAHAAEKIVRIGRAKRDVRIKADGSPVTAADEAAEAIICDGLERLAPAVPIVSEEQAAREKPKAIEQAQLFSGRPARRHTGIHCRPRRIYHQYRAHDRSHAGARHHLPRRRFGLSGAASSAAAPSRLSRDAPNRAAGADPHPAAAAGRARRLWSAARISKRARAPMSTACRGRKLVPSGSSIKFCRLAEGAADLYPRLAPTHDWDIAAGHAILKAAGGERDGARRHAAALRHAGVA